MTQATRVFFELVKAGLWGHTENTESKEKLLWGGVDWSEMYRLASEQAVVGLVAIGIDCYKINDSRLEVPQTVALQFVGQTLQIEQRNKAMNSFVAETVEKLRKEGIYTLLVKGQGIAQCYERPLWRTSGDVDFFFNADNYEKAKIYLLARSSGNKLERLYSKEQGINVGGWYVEAHGTLRTGLSTRVDKSIDEVQNDVFCNGNVRLWMNGNTQVFLPGADDDVFLVFTHFVKHFYKEGGVSVRQLCDWCRLMWTYRDSLNYELLESRIKRAGLLDEWRAFYNLVNKYLGMPDLGGGITVRDSRLDKQSEKIMTFILKGGKWKKWRDTFAVGRIFPMNTLRFASGILLGATLLKVKERVFKH